MLKRFVMNVKRTFVARCIPLALRLITELMTYSKAMQLIVFCVLNGKLTWYVKMPKEEHDYFGATLILTGPVICNDGKKFEYYTWEEHLKMAGFFVESEEKDDEEN